MIPRRKTRGADKRLAGRQPLVLHKDDGPEARAVYERIQNEIIACTAGKDADTYPQGWALVDAKRTLWEEELRTARYHDTMRAREAAAGNQDRD